MVFACLMGVSGIANELRQPGKRATRNRELGGGGDREEAGHKLTGKEEQVRLKRGVLL